MQKENVILLDRDRCAVNALPPKATIPEDLTTNYNIGGFTLSDISHFHRHFGLILHFQT